MEGEEDLRESMIEEDIRANGGDADDKRSKAIISSEQMDVEAYASSYTGRTKIARLIFIAEKCGNTTMELEALRMAYDEIKKGENTLLFRDVVEKIGGRLGAAYGMDHAWVDGVDRRAEARKEKLENELNAYRGTLGVMATNDVDSELLVHETLASVQTNLIKESIRMGYNDFGDFYYAHGALGDAFKNYARTRDYCTTSKHIIQMCLNVILVSIEMGQFTHVTNYVSKTEQTPEALDPVTVAKLRCAAGLAYLENKKYKHAARKNKVIDNVNFRKFLELVPEARIDSHNKILYARHADQRNATFQRHCRWAASLTGM
ncbi:hypothetical protein Syun_012901 [Stephania yunnanensis]|uniref:26S proteasome regulatory subunit Rpn7 N-terminal domain-containing protein n=1 Tax=Stephania yunnanensis TaxID=152371 RepID=A0AAP0PJW5_9MAGN